MVVGADGGRGGSFLVVVAKVSTGAPSGSGSSQKREPTTTACSREKEQRDVDRTTTSEADLLLNTARDPIVMKSTLCYFGKYPDHWIISFLVIQK